MLFSIHVYKFVPNIMALPIHRQKYIMKLVKLFIVNEAKYMSYPEVAAEMILPICKCVQSIIYDCNPYRD